MTHSKSVFISSILRILSYVFWFIHSAYNESYSCVHLLTLVSCPEEEEKVKISDLVPKSNQFGRPDVYLNKLTVLKKKFI